jgi:hypothetical protein
MSAGVNVASNHEFNHRYMIQQKDQNSLMGLFWVSAGCSLTVTSLCLTGGTIALIGLTALSGMAGKEAPISFGNMLMFSAAAGLVDYLAVNFTGYCFSNAIYHYGPEFEIVRR